jgi:hypothetical protein
LEKTFEGGLVWEKNLGGGAERLTLNKVGRGRRLDSCLHRNDKGVGQKSLYNPNLILYSNP